MNVGSCEVREKVELELQAVVSRQLWVLGQRAAGISTTKPISPVPTRVVFKVNSFFFF